MMILQIADWGMLIFHNGLIVFNLLGWAWPKTRRLNLLTLTLTAASWFIGGYWYGWGYCFLTDWHWQIKAARGQTDIPNSYIKYLLDTPTGWDTPVWLVDGLSLSLLLAAVAASVYVNLVRPRMASKASED
jgi:hypothetical protein